MRSLVFDLGDSVHADVLSEQINNNSGVCPRLIVVNFIFDERFFDLASLVGSDLLFRHCAHLQVEVMSGLL